MTEFMKQMTRLVIVALLLLLLVAFSVGLGIWLGSREHTPPQVRSMAPTVTQLERIGELAATRVHVTDVLSAEGEGYRGSWLIKGDALLSLDVSKATIVRVNTATRTATMRLPQPRVVSARVDHDRTKIWSVEKTTWLPWKWGDQGVLRDAAMYHAQQLIESAAASERNLALARSQTELIIHRMYDLVDWKIDVDWE